MDLGIAGKNVVVTGGSRGIGKQIALGFAKEGANVAICARNEGPLRHTEAEICEKNVTVYASICDVGKAADLDAFLEEARGKLGSIDILVNNPTAAADTDDTAGWEASINIDLMASVRASWKVIPWMTEKGGGCLLFISSVSGLQAGSPPAYAAAKAALISYSKTLLSLTYRMKMLYGRFSITWDFLRKKLSALRSARRRMPCRLFGRSRMSPSLMICRLGR